MSSNDIALVEQYRNLGYWGYGDKLSKSTTLFDSRPDEYLNFMLTSG